MDATPAGFWSYVHADDKAEGGRITRLADRLKAEFEVLTGEELALFHDRNIEWGDIWRDRIDNALSSTTFFIPIVTARFYTSEECRREFIKFRGHAESLGVQELVLPILYVAVEDPDEDSDDEVQAAIARTQYVDWRKLRLEDEDSAAHRTGVNALALRLRSIHEAVSDRPRTGVAAAGDEGQMSIDDEAPGILDVLAEGEAALPKLGEAIEGFVLGIESLERVVGDATAQIEVSDNAGKGFAGRLRVARELAAALEEPANRIAESGEAYSSLLLSVDPAILTLIREFDPGGLSPEETEDAAQFFASLEEMAASAAGAAGVIDGMIAAIQGAARFSTDLRSPLRRIERGARGVRDGQSVIDEWVRLGREKRGESEAGGS